MEKLITQPNFKILTQNIQGIFLWVPPRWVILSGITLSSKYLRQESLTSFKYGLQEHRVLGTLPIIIELKFGTQVKNHITGWSMMSLRIFLQTQGQKLSMFSKLMRNPYLMSSMVLLGWTLRIFDENLGKLGTWHQRSTWYVTWFLCQISTF